MFFRIRFSASATTAFSAIVTVPSTWPAAANCWLYSRQSRNRLATPGTLPPTHWDRSAPVPQMQSWHDGAHRRPSHCQACRNLEYLMSSASILPCLIANLQLMQALRHPCASVLALARPHVTSNLPRRTISIPGGEKSRPVSCQFHPQWIHPRILPGPPHSPAAFQNT